MKFISGEEVPEEYLKVVHGFVEEACEAEEALGIENLD